MKNAVLILTNNTGGLHSFRFEVVKAIVDAGYQVFISVPDDNERVKYFERIGCEIVKTRFNRRGMNPLADLMLMLKYLRLIRKVKPMVVLTYTIKPNVYGGVVCRLCNIPQLANVTGLGDTIENGGWKQKLTIFLYKIGLGKAQKVFFQNKSNRDFCIKHHIASDDSVLLPGSGVNFEHHLLQMYPKDGTLKLLFIARLLKDKGIEEFFAMAREIKKKYPDTEFQILGKTEGYYLQQLDELVKEGIINYLGTTPDVRPYLGKVHCTVLPSYHEGMSNVNLESSSNGRPVITTDVPGCQETVDDGVTGFLVKPRDADDLTSKVEKFILLPYEQKVQMGLAARKKMEREFDRNIVIQAYLKEIVFLK